LADAKKDSSGITSHECGMLGVTNRWPHTGQVQSGASVISSSAILSNRLWVTDTAAAATAGEMSSTPLPLSMVAVAQTRDGVVEERDGVYSRGLRRSAQRDLHLLSGGGRGKGLARAAVELGGDLVDLDLASLARSGSRGRYWRGSPLVVSLLPRCHGERGSQK
jgi:hypothetical protein